MPELTELVYADWSLREDSANFECPTQSLNYIVKGAHVHICPAFQF